MIRIMIERLFWYAITFFKIIHPTNQGNVSAKKINSLLSKEGVQIKVLVDSKYKTISLKNMLDFLKYNFAKTQRYIGEIYDCDNFAAVLYGQVNYLLKGFAIGMVHVKTPQGAHALNFFVGRDKLYYIEPQNNNIFSFEQGRKKDYKPYFAII